MSNIYYHFNKYVPCISNFEFWQSDAKNSYEKEQAVGHQVAHSSLEDCKVKAADICPHSRLY